AQDDSRAPVTATVTVTAPLTVTVSTRCLAGKATLVVRAVNEGDTALDIALSSSYGDKAITALQPGAASSVVFTTRQAAVPAGQVTATDVYTPEGYERRLFEATKLYEGHESAELFPYWEVAITGETATELATIQTNVENFVT
ncbi:hypothetical protein ADL26_13330, partial [Thermoactinomyces vulgaris]